MKIPRAISVPVLPKNNRFSWARDALPWLHLKELNLPELLEESIGLLIGTDVPHAHWVIDQRRGLPNEPFAYLTTLDWVVLGLVHGASNRKKALLTTQKETDLAEQITRLYYQDFEDSSACEKELSMDERGILTCGEILSSCEWTFSGGSPIEERMFNFETTVNKCTCACERYELDLFVTQNSPTGTAQ